MFVSKASSSNEGSKLTISDVAVAVAVAVAMADLIFLFIFSNRWTSSEQQTN